jgi:hypothetical protein
VLVASAKQEKLEAGAMVRIDSTVTAALMLREATRLPGASAIHWHDRRRLAKRCATDILVGCRARDVAAATVRCRWARDRLAPAYTLTEFPPAPLRQREISSRRIQPNLTANSPILFKNMCLWTGTS